MKVYAKKIDANQTEIVEALEAAGCSVLRVNGTIDILVGHKGQTHIFEIKDKGGKPTESQLKLLESWTGSPVHIVFTVQQALTIVGV